MLVTDLVILKMTFSTMTKKRKITCLKRKASLMTHSPFCRGRSRRSSPTYRDKRSWSRRAKQTGSELTNSSTTLNHHSWRAKTSGSELSEPTCTRLRVSTSIQVRGNVWDRSQTRARYLASKALASRSYCSRTAEGICMTLGSRASSSMRISNTACTKIKEGPVVY